MTVAIYGHGGHGRTLAAVLGRLGHGVVWLDDDPELGEPPESWREEWVHAVGAGGPPGLRRRAMERMGRLPMMVEDPSAVVERAIRAWRTGPQILAVAHVGPGASLGICSVVNVGALVEHDAVVGDFACIGPGAVLCGGVHVGSDSIVGAGAVVVPGVQIGSRCVVGAGAVVVDDIPDDETWVGNPARRLR